MRTNPDTAAHPPSPDAPVSADASIPTTLPEGASARMDQAYAKRTAAGTHFAALLAKVRPE